MGVDETATRLQKKKCNNLSQKAAVGRIFVQKLENKTENEKILFCIISRLCIAVCVE